MYSFRLLFLSLFCQLFIFITSVKAQPAANYDESKIGHYTLPSLLVTENGKKIKAAKDWEKIRRPVLLQMFKEHVYGRIPGKPLYFHFTVDKVDQNALNGKATRKEVTLYFSKAVDGPAMNLLIYLPNNVSEKVPVFVGLNFQGNHSVSHDTTIPITENWKRINAGKSVERGRQWERWQVEEIIRNGYGLVTAYYEDLEPDHAEGWKTGIRTTMKNDLKTRVEEWGAISAWAWGLSRMMDYLEKEDRVNAKKVVLTGHSRLGKAALWAAANDRRFAIVISNNSGEGGAALARRNFGETVSRINQSFPHWFIQRYKTYNDAPEKLPVDQHMLLALMAPRPLYVASASEDAWADPKGEYLSAWHAGEVYALYGKKGLPSAEQPPVDQPSGDVIRYHLRTGKHDVTLYDWQQYIQFAKKHL